METKAKMFLKCHLRKDFGNSFVPLTVFSRVCVIRISRHCAFLAPD